MHATTIVMTIGIIAAIFGLVNAYDKKTTAIGWGIGLAVLLAMCFGFGAIATIQTHEGEAYGRINAVERGGIFHDTTAVYIKTDRESSQEDLYCSPDPDVTAKLRHFARTGEQVRITFTDHFMWAEGCEWADTTGGAVIRSVESAA